MDETTQQSLITSIIEIPREGCSEAEDGNFEENSVESTKEEPQDSQEAGKDEVSSTPSKGEKDFQVEEEEHQPPPDLSEMVEALTPEAALQTLKDLFRSYEAEGLPSS